MAARLRAASASGEPVLLRIEAGGHGLTYAFIFDRLGVGYREVRRDAV